MTILKYYVLFKTFIKIKIFLKRWKNMKFMYELLTPYFR